MNRRPLELSLRQQLERLTIHDHACLLCDDPRQTADALAIYCEIGLQRGERCWLRLSPTLGEATRAALGALPIDTDRAERTGALLWENAATAYRSEGGFDVDGLVGGLREIADAAEAEGFTGLRVAGDGASFSDHVDHETVRAYELQVEEILSTSRAQALCVYPRRTASGRGLWTTVHTHRRILLDGVLCENAASAPVAAAAEEDPSGAAEDVLDRVLADARQRLSLGAARGAVSGPADEQIADEHGRRSLIECMAEGVCLLDAAGEISEVNAAAARLFGLPPEQLLGCEFPRLCSAARGDGKQCARKPCAVDAVLRDGVEVSRETVCWRRPGATDVMVLLSATPLRDNAGVVDGAAVTLTDITEQRQAEHQLAFQAQLLDSVRESVVATDLDGKVTYWGRGAEELYHKTAAEALGRSILFIVAPDDRDAEEARMREVLETGQWQGEYLQRRADGSSFWAQTRISLVRDACGRPIGFIGIDRDVTDRRRAEEALQLMQYSVDHASEVIVAADRAGRLLYVNDRACAHFGAPREALLRKTAFELNPSFQGDGWDKHWQRVKAAGSLTVETTHQDAAGRLIPARVNTNYLNYGGTEYLFAFARDVSEQKAAEDALRESEQRYRLLAEHAADLISRHDADGTFRYVSPASARLLGFEPEELVGRMAYELFHPDDIPAVRRSHETILAEDAVAHVQYRLRRKDGEYLWAETNSHAVRDPATGEIAEIIAVTRDISARKAAETLARHRQDELVHAARLSTIGEMASGVAHELNQPLGAICTYADVLDEACVAGDLARARDTARWIAAQARRASLIIARLQGFVRKQRPHRSTVALNDVVRDALPLIEGAIVRERVALTQTLADDLPVLHGDRVQLQQVLLNLLRNGLDAMHAAADADRRLTVSTALRDGKLRLSVADSGVGLGADVQARLFDPFFTTKAEGLGLGLSLSRTIVEDHGGRLWATANPDRGATFHIELPPAAAGVQDE